MTVVVLEVILLIFVSAICSGLNIAIMSLNVNDLKRKAADNNRAAKRVLPLRINTHLTLVSILLANVAAVSANSILLSHYINGWLAAAISTLLIVLFGEILPQALFIKNPLGWSAFLAPFMQGIIAITFIISKPLQVLLDKTLPSTINVSQLQSRNELSMLMAEHLNDDSSELDDDEVEIMKGALLLSEKKVKDIMTPFKDTFFLDPMAKLDSDLIQNIKIMGYSRIPIINKQRTHCHGILIMKSLIDIDFDESELSVMELPLYPVKTVGSQTALDTLFRKFISQGTHLMPVEKENKIIGIVTIEDLIEEIIGHEIEDESDIDDKTKQRQLNLV